MSVFEITLLGLALSMDAFAVSISNLMAYPHLPRTKRVLLPLTFGVFQGLMPLIGYFVGSLAADFINTIAGPVALVLLGFIGGKMIIESVIKIRNEKSACAQLPDPDTLEDRGQAQTVNAKQETLTRDGEPDVSLNRARGEEPAAAGQASTLTVPAILVQGIATSLDALIVGVSLLALNVNIIFASSVIALTTFVCCAVALVIGKRLGCLLGDKAQIIGGAILVLIGIKACFF